MSRRRLTSPNLAAGSDIKCAHGPSRFGNTKQRRRKGRAEDSEAHSCDRGNRRFKVSDCIISRPLQESQPPKRALPDAPYAATWRSRLSRRHVQAFAWAMIEAAENARIVRVETDVLNLLQVLPTPQFSTVRATVGRYPVNIICANDDGLPITRNGQSVPTEVMSGVKRANTF